MNRSAKWTLAASLLLGATALLGCAKKPATVSGGPKGKSETVVYRVADHWSDVTKEWQLPGQARTPCKPGWQSPVPELYTAGIPTAKLQKITDTVIMAVPAYSPQSLIGQTFLGLSVALPAKPTKLEFSTYLLKTSAPSDGVRYQVLCDGASAFDAIEGGFSPTPREADLSKYAGKTVKIELVTDAGPHNNVSADWALWGDPKIVTTR